MINCKREQPDCFVLYNLMSLPDMPDPGMDKLWAEEAELRLEAFQSGKLKSIALEDVLSKYK